MSKIVVKGDFDVGKVRSILRQVLGQGKEVDRLLDEISIGDELVDISDSSSDVKEEFTNQVDALAFATKIFAFCDGVIISTEEKFLPSVEGSDSDQPPTPRDPHSIGLKGGNLKPAEDAERQALLVRPISELTLSKWAFNCIDRGFFGEVKTIADLVAKSADGLLGIRCLGKKHLQEIREKLAEFGLKLKGDE